MEDRSLLSQLAPNRPFNTQLHLTGQVFWFETFVSQLASSCLETKCHKTLHLECYRLLSATWKNMDINEYSPEAGSSMSLLISLTTFFKFYRYIERPWVVDSELPVEHSSFRSQGFVSFLAGEAVFCYGANLDC